MKARVIRKVPIANDAPANQKADHGASEQRRISKRAVALGIPVLLLLLYPYAVKGQAPPRPQKKGDKTSAAPLPSSNAEVARGKYIVENVAMCPQCHTPRDGNGALDPSRPLDGASEFFQPPHPDPNWPLKAPRIGGNPPASDQDLVRLLTTGIWTDGKPLRLPMMPFRMNEADAKAVVAYLKSVRQGP